MLGSLSANCLRVWSRRYGRRKGHSSSRPFRIAVAGGGYAAADLIHYLYTEYGRLRPTEIVWIDDKTYFEHNIASLRAFVDKETAKIVHVDYTKLIPVEATSRWKNFQSLGEIGDHDGDNTGFSLKLVHGKLESICTQDGCHSASSFISPMRWEVASCAAQLPNANSKVHLEFDVGVIAIGANYVDSAVDAVASTAEERQEQFDTIRQEFEQEKIKSAVIVGGGPVGVELAAELKNFFHSLKVSLIHDDERLLPLLRPEVGAYALKRLSELGVDVHLEDRLLDGTTKTSNGILETRNGRSLCAERVFWCTGVTPRSECLKKLPEALDGSGYIQVDDSLRVLLRTAKKGHQNAREGLYWTDKNEEARRPHMLFAMGDCAGTGEVKVRLLPGYRRDMAKANDAQMAMHAKEHARIVGDIIGNILSSTFRKSNF